MERREVRARCRRVSLATKGVACSRGFWIVWRLQPSDTIADVGVTSDREHDHSNYLEAWYPHKSQITAVGIEDASFLEHVFPGVTFIRASGTALPFANDSFDFVHSSAVIEHAGGFFQQTQLLSEIWRIARRGVFVTTPNRWFPIELHTVLPLLHYLPPRQYRLILKKIGLGFFAEESNLNLMSGADSFAGLEQCGLDQFLGSFGAAIWIDV